MTTEILKNLTCTVVHAFRCLLYQKNKWYIWHCEKIVGQRVGCQNNEKKQGNISKIITGYILIDSYDSASLPSYSSVFTWEHDIGVLF